MQQHSHPRTRIARVRTRTLTFRVTDEEFDRLQDAAGRSGACLSEFIRQAALQVGVCPDDNPQDGWVKQQLRIVHDRMNRLEIQISQLHTSRPDLASSPGK
jgi:hypothetical protein